MILSAEFGLVEPERPPTPYDVALASLPALERRQWGGESPDRY